MSRLKPDLQRRLKPGLQLIRGTTIVFMFRGCGGILSVPGADFRAGEEAP